QRERGQPDRLEGEEPDRQVDELRARQHANALSTGCARWSRLPCRSAAAHGLTTWSGRPSRKAMMLSTGIVRERAFASAVTAPAWGIRTTVSRSLKGFASGGSGSWR